MNHNEFKLTAWCIENRTTIYIFTIIITIAGILTWNSLPKEQFPDIVVPTIFVSTIYPGTSPSDVENLIAKPIEKQLKSIAGVKKIRSNSIQDFASVIVEFNTGIDVQTAKQRVQDAVDKAKADLPTDLDKDPQVNEVDFSEFPIMNINLSGNFPIDKLKVYAEVLQDEIEGMSQITRVDIVGALNREIQINLDLYKIQAAGLNFTDVERAIASENVNISGGELNVDNVRRTLRVVGEFKDVSQIRDISINSATGASVRLGDVADVRDNYAEKQDYARLDGKTVVTLNVIKRGGENLIEAADNIEHLITKLKAEKFPENLSVVVTADQSERTRAQLNDLINTVVLGFIFVVFVLMFFMGTTDAFFVATSVPLSFLLALLFLPALDFSLNVIVMFSFLLALGIVVDDAIVVIENTHRLLHLHPEYTPAKAAKVAAGEVFIPVLSGTLTTVAPFFPLLFWPGIVGEFMKYLPVTLIFTLFASLIVAYVINPVFAANFMTRKDHDAQTNHRVIIKPLLVLVVLTVIGYLISFAFGNFFALIIILYLLNHFVFSWLIAKFQSVVLPAFMRRYRGLIRFVIGGYKPYVFFTLSILLLVGVVMATVIKKPKVNFFPSGEPNFIYVYTQMPIGTDAFVTDSVTKIIEGKIYEVIGRKNPIVQSVISNVGIGAGDPQNPDRVVAPHKSKVTVALVKFEDRIGVSTQAMLEKVRNQLTGIAGAQISVEKESSGPPTGKPISIEIAGESFDELLNVEKKVRQTITREGIAGIENLRSDLVINKPEILIDIDRERANREGISTAQVGLELRTALYGKEISRFRDAEEDFPIMLRLAPEQRTSVETLLSMPISYRDMAKGGVFRQVPLSAFAKIRYSSTFSTINRKNQQRMVTLSSNVLTGYNANEIVQQIEAAVKRMDLPQGYTVKMGGEQEDQKETGTFLVGAFVSAIGLIFLILVTQFNSVSKPIIIFITVLFSLIGVLLGFLLTDMTISVVMTGVGVVALAGIVVKNGIILIEFTDELRSRGYELKEAIIEAGAVRLIPVFLTAAAAILGLVPLAIGMNVNWITLFTHLNPDFYVGGDSVVFWGPLAWTIIFGLSFSTFLTLVILPAMYYINDRIRTKVFGKKDTNIIDPNLSSNAHQSAH